MKTALDYDTEQHYNNTQVGIAGSFTDISWLPSGSKLDLFLSDLTPPPALVSHAFASSVFSRHLEGRTEKFALFTMHAKRGIQIPGGRKEKGESVMDCAIREGYEETGVRLTKNQLKPVGYARIWCPGPKPEGSIYPHPFSYMSFYRATGVFPEHLPTAGLTECFGTIIMEMSKAISLQSISDVDRIILREIQSASD